VRADLHTHSNRSDGTDTPGDLVRAAAAAGLDVVALTDHDAADGWDEAAATAADVGIGFVPGMEVSCRHHGRPVHLLAYGVDPHHPLLAQELGRILDGRSRRLPAILRGLAEAGITLSLSDVHAVAPDTAALGRPHVADALIAAGVVADRREAFVRFLMPGGPGYVQRHAAELLEMVGLVAAAGGVAVVAHPWGRSSRTVLTPAALAELARAGLVGLEVQHRDQSERDTRGLAALARDLGLLQTGSSDYHGIGKVDHDLGCFTTAPAQLDRLLAAMATSADRARAADPTVRPAAALAP
jgi:hypothetical protein